MYEVLSIKTFFQSKQIWLFFPGDKGQEDQYRIFNSVFP